MPYAMLSAFPFNIIALVLGQSVIMLPGSHLAGSFNIRYGILLLPGAALFIGFLADYLLSRAPLFLVGMLFTLFWRPRHSMDA